MRKIVRKNNKLRAEKRAAKLKKEYAREKRRALAQEKSSK
ncbi:Uncharacterised protein [Mycoplasmopsis pulmonis]|nr:Uncharacterised protein [Mycoplasmopsis pulmonis]